MKFSVILILVLCCATLTLACSKKCQKKKNRAALEKACSEISGGTKIKLEIDIAGGGCRPPCKKKKKKNMGEEAHDEAPADQEAPPAEGDAAPAEGDAPPPAGDAPPAEGDAPPPSGDDAPQA